MGQYCSSEVNLVVAESGASHLSAYQGRYTMKFRPDADPATANPRDSEAIYYTSDENVIWYQGRWRVGPLSTWDGSGTGDIVAQNSEPFIMSGDERRESPYCPHDLSLHFYNGYNIDMNFNWRYLDTHGEWTASEPNGVYTLPGKFPFRLFNV